MEVLQRGLDIGEVANELEVCLVTNRISYFLLTSSGAGA